MFRKKSKKPSTKPPGGERTSHTAPLDQGASETTVEPEVVGPEELPGELELDEPQSETEKGIETKALIRGSGAPGISDALTTYLREIAQYPPLSREEEHDLAVRYVQKKDLDAAYRLVSSNLWLVVKIAREYERAARNLLDLVQEGNMGLMEAVKNFDPYRGVRLPSYAAWWIKAYIVRYLIANWRMVKIGTTQAQRKLFFNLSKERERLEREGFVPTAKLLAEKLDVRESDVVEMEQRLGGSDVSVDAPIGEDGGATLLSVLPDAASSAEDLLAQKQFKSLLSESLADFSRLLNEKERLVLEQRLLSDEKATLHEIAERLSVSAERVRQIENKVKEKLKEFLESRFEDSGEEVF